ncbi:MAG: hypothetical protein JHC33_14200 [Ignisphaera sp.]|nr:hypothetical protein [Ignisphaera sp.]
MTLIIPKDFSDEKAMRLFIQSLLFLIDKQSSEISKITLALNKAGITVV